MPSIEPSPGVPRERTRLSWERAGFSYLTLAAIVLGVAAHREQRGLLGLSALLVIVAVAVWRHGARSAGERRPQALAGVTAATAVTAIATAVAVATS